MAIRDHLDETTKSAAATAVDRGVLGAATVSAMLNEHSRLRGLLKDAIAAMPASDEDYWVGVGIDEVVVRGESAEAVMAAVEASGILGGTVVIEFVSCEPKVFIL